MMASGFFDGGPDRDYIRSMLELYLNPPSNEQNDLTLPLLICGSPRYDPQAPGWFRTAYKDLLKDAEGIPRTDVLQTGTFKVREDSAKETPFMVANHMIAAGVTGVCTGNPSEMPDIRLYEAMDLVAATFLHLLVETPGLGAEAASQQACMRWFGAPSPFAPSTSRNSMGELTYLAPNPPDPEDKLVICALAQMDMFFTPTPSPHDTYTFDEAMARCRAAADAGNPCCPDIAPPPPHG